MLNWARSIGSLTGPLGTEFALKEIGQVVAAVSVSNAFTRMSDGALLAHQLIKQHQKMHDWAIQAFAAQTMLNAAQLPIGLGGDTLVLAPITLGRSLGADAQRAGFDLENGQVARAVDDDVQLVMVVACGSCFGPAQGME